MDLVHILKADFVLTWIFPAVLTLILYFLTIVIQKVAIDKGSVRAAQTVTLWDDLIVDVIRHIRRYFIFALSLYLGLIWVKLSPRTRMLVDKAFIIIVLIQFAQVAGLIINFWITKHLKAKSDRDLAMASTVGLISIAVKFIVYSLILLMALNNIGVDITALVAGLGVGGIAVALAMQNILADLFSSLTIVLDKPFIVGDFIIVNDLMGTVEHIGLKTTRLRSLSGEQLIFGNGDLLQSRIKNYKRMAERRIVTNITVVYQTSADLLEKIPSMIQEIVNKEENARFDRCHFLRFQDSSLEFELVYWVNSREFNVYADSAQSINIGIFRKFAQEKIDFAYPTRTLYVHKE